MLPPIVNIDDLYVNAMLADSGFKNRGGIRKDDEDEDGDEENIAVDSNADIDNVNKDNKEHIDRTEEENESQLAIDEQKRRSKAIGWLDGPQSHVVSPLFLRLPSFEAPRNSI